MGGGRARGAAACRRRGVRVRPDDAEDHQQGHDAAESSQHLVLADEFDVSLRSARGHADTMRFLRGEEVPGIEGHRYRAGNRQRGAVAGNRQGGPVPVAGDMPVFDSLSYSACSV